MFVSTGVPSVCNTFPKETTYQVVINLPTVEELEHPVNKNIHTELEENDDDRERQIILHVLLLDAVEGRETDLPARGSETTTLEIQK